MSDETPYLKAEIVRLRKELDYYKNYTNERDYDQRNAGATIMAQKLRQIADTGEHAGTFGSPEIEAAAQSILTLHREKEHLWDRIKHAYPN